MNKAIPIIAIQLNAFVVEDVLTLNFVKVLDLVEAGEEEEIDQEQTTRKHWDGRANAKSMELYDSLVELVKELPKQGLHIIKVILPMGLQVNILFGVIRGRPQIYSW